MEIDGGFMSKKNRKFPKSTQNISGYLSRIPRQLIMLKIPRSSLQRHGIGLRIIRKRIKQN